MRNAIFIVVGIVLGMVAVELFRNSGGLQASIAERLGVSGEEGVTVQVGGPSDNKLDACWVLERRKGQNGIETHLALYRMVAGGKGLVIQLQDSRQLDWDLRIPQYRVSEPSVSAIKTAVEKAQKTVEEKKPEK